MCMCCSCPALCSVIVAAVLVTIGYFALWTSSQTNTPKGTAAFGKVMALILFVMAGLMILFSCNCKGAGKRRMMMNRIRGDMPCMSYKMGREEKVPGAVPFKVEKRAKCKDMEGMGIQK